MRKTPQVLAFLAAAFLPLPSTSFRFLPFHRRAHLLRIPVYQTLVMSVERRESLTIAPIERCTGEVILPGSKSLSNRALLLAALSTGNTTVENLLDSDDIRFAPPFE